MIRLVEDVGAPVAVTVVDMVTQSAAPQWNSWANYAMTVIGYAGAYLNMGGDFVKNIGVASLPKSLAQLYATVAMPAAVKIAGYRVSQTQVPGFGGVKLI